MHATSSHARHSRIRASETDVRANAIERECECERERAIDGASSERDFARDFLPGASRSRMGVSERERGEVSSSERKRDEATEDGERANAERGTRSARARERERERRRRRPSERDVTLAYETFDVNSRGFFTARDVRRACDANGFSEWTDEDVRRMCAAFKPRRVRDVACADDRSMFNVSRKEFVDIVHRTGARVEVNAREN